MKRSILPFLAVGMIAILMASCKTEPPKSVLKHYEATGEDGSIVESSDYEYDENGNLLSVIHHNGGNGYDNSNKTMYKYDENNRLISVTDYYDGDANTKTVYTYNENGDTTSCTYSWKDEDSWKVTNKLTYQYQDGKLTHKYEYYNCLNEGEGPSYDMVTDHVYDKDGKETSAKFYNLTYENDVYEIEIQEAVSASPANEFKQIVADNSFGVEGQVVYTYNSAGKLVSSKRTDNNNGSESVNNEYDANGNLTKSVSESIWDGSDPYITTSVYTNNKDGKCTKCVQTTQNDSYFSVYTKEYEFDANGDTLSYVATSTFEGKTYVENKLRYTYSSPGVKKYVYSYSTVDEWGHDMQTVEKKEYNENGQIVGSVIYDMNDYNDQYDIEKEYSGNAEEELKHYIGKYNMTMFYTYKYTYEDIVVDHSFAAKVKGFFGGDGKDSKKEAAKSEEGVEYDV